jgi:hypothetical protein
VCPDPKSGGLPSPSHPSVADQGLEPCPPWCSVFQKQAMVT